MNEYPDSIPIAVSVPGCDGVIVDEGWRLLRVYRAKEIA
jgi:hypothetical protein